MTFCGKNCIMVLGRFTALETNSSQPAKQLLFSTNIRVSQLKKPIAVLADILEYK